MSKASYPLADPPKPVVDRSQLPPGPPELPVISYPG